MGHTTSYSSTPKKLPATVLSLAFPKPLLSGNVLVRHQSSRNHQKNKLKVQLLFFDNFPRWDAKRLEREAAAKAKEQQKPPVPPTKVCHIYFFDDLPCFVR